MPYASRLLDNMVTDSSDAVIGKLADILISPQEGKFAPLEYLEVKQSRDAKPVFIPYGYVANFDNRLISLKSLFSKIPLSEIDPKNYIFLKRDVLDKQIVDIAGTRVVRVNDLRLGNFDGQTCVLAIDPSFRGLLRRLGLEDFLFSRFFKVQLIDWRQAQFLGHGPLQLNTLSEELSHLHPADLANIVEDLDIQTGSQLLASLETKEAAKVLEEVDPRWQNILVKYMGPEKASKILAQMSTDEIVDLVKSFSSEEAQVFLSHVSNGRAKSVEKLLKYPDNTAGGLMTTEYVTVRPDWTVQQAIQEINKASPLFRSIVYVYVTEEDGRFFGVVSLRRLMAAAPQILIAKLAKLPEARSTLKPEDKIKKVVRLMTRYNLYTAAVVDKDRKLVGIVTIDDVMRQLYPTA